MISKRFNQLRLYFLTGPILRKIKLKSFLYNGPIKVNIGCGTTRQDGYLNIDVRYTPTIDIKADMAWCFKHLKGKCKEVYISHILEHFESPGKEMRAHGKSVLGFLNSINQLLVPGGIIRIAVPDFHALASLYIEKQYPLYPRLLGRLCGEQNYKKNVHKCLFDRDFLTMCLLKCGFVEIEDWNPYSLGFHKDGSFDELLSIQTSLNLQAKKCSPL